VAHGETRSEYQMEKISSKDTALETWDYIGGKCQNEF